MKFNFNWKTILATVLMIVGVAVALTAEVGIVTIGAIVSIVIGASIGISEAMKKTSLTGWKKYVFLISIISSSVLFAMSSYTEQTVLSIVSAIVLLLSVIFGVAVDKTKKVKEKKD